MCNGSRSAKSTRKAQSGDNLLISLSPHGFGVLHEPGVHAGFCVTCVKDGTRVTLWSIPARLQRRLRIEARVVVMFADGGDQQDYVKLPDGRDIKLGVFAKCWWQRRTSRIRAYIGVMEDVAPPRVIDDASPYGMPPLTAEPEDIVLTA